MICRHGRSKHSESRFYFSFQCYINGFNCVKYERIFQGITLRAHQNSSSPPPPPPPLLLIIINFTNLWLLWLIEEIANRFKKILSTILCYELYPSETSNIFMFLLLQMFLWLRLIYQCYFLHDADNAVVDNAIIEIFPEVVGLSVCSRVICCLFFRF